MGRTVVECDEFEDDGKYRRVTEVVGVDRNNQLDVQRTSSWRFPFLEIESVK